MEDILIFAALAAIILLWVWALLDLVFSTFKKPRWKLAWLLIILFFPLVGSILYLLLKNDFKIPKRRTFQPKFRPDSKR